MLGLIARTGLVLFSLVFCGLMVMYSLRSFTAANALERTRDLMGQGLYDQAADLLARSIATMPTNADAHHRQGDLSALRAFWRRQPDRLEDAIQSYRRAARLNPHDGDHFYWLGWTQLQAKLYSEAEQSLRQALKLDPHNASYTLTVGQIFQARGNNKKALEWYKKANTIKPNDPQITASIRNLEAKP